MQHLVQNGCVLLFGESWRLGKSALDLEARMVDVPVCALNILAVLSTPPVMKYWPSGDQARS